MLEIIVCIVLVILIAKLSMSGKKSDTEKQHTGISDNNQCTTNHGVLRSSNVAPNTEEGTARGQAAEDQAEAAGAGSTAGSQSEASPAVNGVVSGAGVSTATAGDGGLAESAGTGGTTSGGTGTPAGDARIAKKYQKEQQDIIEETLSYILQNSSFKNDVTTSDSASNKEKEVGIPSVYKENTLYESSDDSTKQKNLSNGNRIYSNSQELSGKLHGNQYKREYKPVRNNYKSCVSDDTEILCTVTHQHHQCSSKGNKAFSASTATRMQQKEVPLSGVQLVEKFSSVSSPQEFCQLALDKIHSDFWYNLGNIPRWCELRNVSFQGSCLPNYSSLIQEQLYLLRYMPAYLFEYYEAYSLLKELGFTCPRIVSLGCGAGIDGVAAHFVFPECSWEGVDIVPWKYWCLKNNPIIESAECFVPDTQNVFFFPKSMNEFDFRIVNGLCKNLVNTSADSICIINSRRSEKSYDSKFGNMIYNYFIKYFSQNSVKVKTIKKYITPKGRYLSGYQPGFRHKFSQKLSVLSHYCPSSKTCIEKDECNISRYPILKDLYFQTDICVISKN